MLGKMTGTMAWALAFFPASVYGHPGHGVEGGSQSVWHYLFEPQHAGGAVVVVALFAVVVLVRRRVVRDGG